MIVISMDSRNIVVGFDNLHAKLLVAMLKRVTPEQMMNATIEVNKAGGFTEVITDADAARSSFVSVVGAQTDTLFSIEKLQEIRKTEEEAAVAAAVTSTPKDHLN